MHHRSTVEQGVSKIRVPCSILPSASWMQDAGLFATIRQPLVTSHLWSCRQLTAQIEIPQNPADICQGHKASQSQIIRARPIGEANELLSSEGNSDDDFEVRGNLRTNSPAAACGWSRFVDAARRFIQRPRSDLDENRGEEAACGDVNLFVGGGGAAKVAESPTAPPPPPLPPPSMSFLGGLTQLLLISCWDVIHPDSKFRTGWDMFIIFCLLYVALVTTYLLCFQFDGQSHATFFAVVDILINVAFLLDIFLNFRTALRKGEDAVRRHQVTTDRRKLAMHYLSGWFAVDIVAALPWSYITRSLASYMQLLKLLRLVRLLRLLQMSKAMQRSRLYMNMEHTQGAAVARVMSYAIGAVLVLHMSASAWFFVAVMESNDLSGTWAEAAGLQDATNYERYLTSLYFVVVTFTTVGYGDVYPVTTAERFLTCLGMLIGVVTLGYIISTANTIAGKANKYELAKSELLDKVENFLSAHPLPTEMAAHIKTYYTYVARRRFNDQDDAELVASLPLGLRRDVLRAMHSHLIARVPFLNQASQHHEALVLDISAAIKLEFFCRGQCVVMEGGWDTEMYFITEGKFHVHQFVYGPQRWTASVAGGETAQGDSAAATTAQQNSRQEAATAAPAVPQQQAGAALAAGGEADDSQGAAGGRENDFEDRTERSTRRSSTDLNAVRRWLATAGQCTTLATPSPGIAVLDMYGGSPVQELLAQPQQAQAAGDGTEKRGDLGHSFLGRGGNGGEPAAAAPVTHGSPLEVRQQQTQAEVELVPTDKPPNTATRQPLVRDVPPQTDQARKRSVLFDSAIPSKLLRKLMTGDSFGEYSCLTGCPRTASVVAVQMCEVYCLTRSDLAAAMSRWPGLEAAWKRCDEYGVRERQRLCLKSDHGSQSMYLRTTGDPYDNRPQDIGAEAIIHSQQRYHDFLLHFNDGTATADVASHPTAAVAAVAAKDFSGLSLTTSAPLDGRPDSFVGKG